MLVGQRQQGGVQSNGLTLEMASNGVRTVEQKYSIEQQTNR